MNSRIHIWTASSLLLAYGIYSLAQSGPALEPMGIAFGSVSLAASVFLMLRSPWSWPITLALCFSMIGFWVLAAFSGPNGEYLARLSPRDAALSLVPGLLWCLLPAYCAYVAHRAARARSQT